MAESTEFLEGPDKPGVGILVVAVAAALFGIGRMFRTTALFPGQLFLAAASCSSAVARSWYSRQYCSAGGMLGTPSKMVEVILCVVTGSQPHNRPLITVIQKIVRSLPIRAKAPVIRHPDP
jgi:hypothetical protein